MPKKVNRKNAKSKASSDTSSMAFHLVGTSGGVTGVIGIQPSQLGAVIAQRADSYELFRVVKLKFRALPNGVTQALCYLPGVTDTPPSTLVATAVVPYSTYITSPTTVPSPWVSVPRQVLRGYLDWYKTIAGTPDPSVEIQGNIGYTASSSGVTYEIRGTILFSGSVDPGSTPMMRRQALVAKEYSRLQFILLEGPKTGLPVSKIP